MGFCGSIYGVSRRLLGVFSGRFLLNFRLKSKLNSKLKDFSTLVEMIVLLENLVFRGYNIDFWV